MLLRFVRNRTYLGVVMYSLDLYFLGLSLRNTSKALEPFKDQKSSYVTVWDGIQPYRSFHFYYKHRRVSAFIIDKNIIHIGNHHFWLWICIEPIDKLYLKPLFLKRKT